MGNVDWIVEIVLIGLLAATLVYAVRLERALGVLRQDRAAFGEAVAGFDSSTRQAEAGMGKLQSFATEVAQAVARRVEQAAALKDDLAFLNARGEALADRLEALVRAGRAVAPVSAPMMAPDLGPPPQAAPEPLPKVRSQAERDLLLALRAAQ